MRHKTFALGIVALLIAPCLGLFSVGGSSTVSAPSPWRDVGLFVTENYDYSPIVGTGKRPWLNPARAALKA